MASVHDRIDELLDRVREHDSELRAFIAVRDTASRARAKALDTMSPAERGPLHGTVMCLKDNIDVAGVPSTAGAPYRSATPAAADAVVTRLLVDAGAVVLGKNNMAEFAMGATGRNRTFGDCRNARDAGRISGGSSSGSAVAVAAGMVDAALGTDTGGSGRIPAAVNGVVGIRPTHGRVSNVGVLPVSPSFDTVTPISRDVATASGVLAALDKPASEGPVGAAGHRIPVGTALDAGAGGMRIGLAGGYFDAGVDPGVRAAIADTIQHLRSRGATVIPVEVPDADRAQERMLAIMYPEAATVHAEQLWQRPETVDPDVLRRLQLGARTDPEDTAHARRWQAEFRKRVDDLFDAVDVIVSPTIPVDVPERGKVDLSASTRDIARFTYVWSMYGGPSASIPCGRHPASGMPVGLQIAAPPWHEHLVLRAAFASMTWKHRSPRGE